MKKSRFADSQIIEVLKKVKGGTPLRKPCREYGISSATMYKSRTKLIEFVAFSPSKVQIAGLESDPAVYIGESNESFWPNSCLCFFIASISPSNTLSLRRRACSIASAPP